MTRAKLLPIFLLVALSAYAQDVERSNGVDGTLDLTTPGIVVFDPKSFTPQLNAAGDNIFQFTSIRIGKGVTVKVSSDVFSGPVFWLSSGPIVIDGTIDLSGESSRRTPSPAGAGGYDGGARGKPGYGPEGFTSNVFLVPLVGGSGGVGGETQGGGAGGGAFLLASTTSVTINGAILANGGASVDGDGGNGGAIRIVAPTIDGTNGVLSARGGQPRGIDGRIRLEAFEKRFTGTFSDTPVFEGSPLGLFLPPSPPPSIRVVSIDGVPTTTPDFTIHQSSPVTVAIEARNIPPGTTLELEFFPEAGAGQTLVTTPLVGSFARSQATASVTITGGSSRVYAKATWNQPRD